MKKLNILNFKYNKKYIDLQIKKLKQNDENRENQQMQTHKDKTMPQNWAKQTLSYTTYTNK